MFDINFFDTSVRYTTTETVSEEKYFEKENIISSMRTNMGDSVPKWADFWKILDGTNNIPDFWYKNTTNNEDQVEFANEDELHDYDWSHYEGGYLWLQDYAEVDIVSDIIELINVEQRNAGITDIIDPYIGGAFIGKGYYYYNSEEEESEYVTCVKIKLSEESIDFTINYSCTVVDMKTKDASIRIDREAGYYNVTKEEEVAVFTIGQQLNGVVSKWYNNLTNLAILILLIILIYVGIRIIIGSTAGQKAKYKERLMDWLVAMCLLFVMHYIMIFAVNLTQKFTELITTLREESGTVVIIPLEDEHIHSIEEMEDGQEEGKYTEEYENEYLNTNDKLIRYYDFEESQDFYRKSKKIIREFLNKVFAAMEIEVEISIKNELACS